MHEENSYTPTEIIKPSIQKPKIFSLTQTMTHRENLDPNHGRPTPIGINSPFKPRSKNGPDFNAKRAMLFPKLQRFQRPVQQQGTRPTPFFSLLNSNTPPTRTSTPFLNAAQYHQKITHTSDHGTKIETTSDSEFSSPPPSFQDPIQMLPPPPPPTGPISRPGSRTGSRSRSGSTTSFSREEAHLNSPDSSALKSTGLPDIAINALRELQTVTTEFHEQRRQTQNLLAQLNSLCLTHEELKTTHDHLIQEHDSTQKQLLSARKDLAAANEVASGSNVEILAAKDDLTSSQQKLGLAHQEIESSNRVIEELRVEANDFKENLKLERDEAKIKFGKARKGLAEINNSYKELRTMFEALQISHQNSLDLLQEMRMARSAAADGLRVIEPLLDEGGSYVHASEMKILVSDLQNEVADSHRVNDLLRDKLYHQSSQLAQANERARELEETERARLGELVAVLKGEHGDVNGRSEELLNKVEYLTARLVKREEETIDVLAEAAVLEAKLSDANSTLEDTRKALETTRTELSTLRGIQEEKRALEARLDDLAARFTYEQDALRTALAELDDARSCGQKNGAVIESLESDIQVLKEEKTLTSAALREAQDMCKQLEAKVSAEVVRKEVLEEEIEKLRKRHTDRETKLRDTDSAIAALQERFDAQCITLRLSKEHCGDVQDSCKKAQDALVVETTKTISARSRVEFLEEEISKLKQKYSSKEDALALETIKGAVTQSRVEALEEDLVKARKEIADSERDMREMRKRAEEDLAKVRRDGADREGIFRQEQDRAMLLQDRYDTQERLTVSEASFATKLTSATGKLEAALAVLKERNSAIQMTLDDIKHESSARQASLIAASADFEKKFAKQESTSDQLINAERGRSNILEREIADSKGKVAELKRNIEVLQEQLQLATERGEGIEVEQVMLLKCKVEELKKVNQMLISRAGCLKERYSSGDLDDDEKDFIDYLMKISYALHEQQDVARDNELRRRDNMVNTLHGRIRELESSLARLLRDREVEAGNITKSMVDLSLWMSSSPIAPDQPEPASHLIPSNKFEDNLEPPIVVVGLNEASTIVSKATTTPPSLKPSDSSTMTIRVPAKLKVKPKGKVETSKPAIPKPHATFSTLALDSDSEEDTPLSELSDMSTVLGKRDRIPSPAKEKAQGTKPRRNAPRQAVSVPSSQQAIIVPQKKTTDPTKPKKKRKQ
ncbi:hypothetical protein BDZ94DRAFT_1326565 [Collybia nuda]|uniref:Uncharacterized protein n=1 Tax=Collybia nuda TaxID=64659 RepID=A0A9P6C976_9AGAR|nr:hypothetical protein BDZ94DRAFT_1326565 [Collybia nuda]